MTNYRIRLKLEPNPGGVFTVTSPDVPGLVTEGETAAEIQANVQEALDALFEAWTSLGKEPPPALQPMSSEHHVTIEMLVTAA
ncbi:MAG TPA: type II toxin-antitoxin system HicB family antitoxin [Pyrinomonadaceae bacterium]|jgi:antitoxin HicB